ncbi:class I SAM-dependent methyltransferase [Helicobacter pametensis]|uniref:class I SAM-dependent methyltransferase n=1 Tax=Helicobacter pametensis TaxID=95149 RepID=UPI000483C9BA|nr:rRNA adenine N-6-methyltransferase family protein [Helicobacter pametensis]
MLWHFLRNPRKIGAVCSSSRSLASAMIEGMGIEEARNIAEIGPGLGVFTHEILRIKQPHGQFFALEVNPVFVKELQKTYPQAKIFHRGAEEILDVLSQEGISEGLDAVVSGLPWSVFSSKEQDFLLEKIYASLREGGTFSTFAYVLPTPQAKRFRKKLFTIFDSVRISRIVWRNFPPACVYYCQK